MRRWARPLAQDPLVTKKTLDVLEWLEAPLQRSSEGEDERASSADPPATNKARLELLVSRAEEAVQRAGDLDSVQVAVRIAMVEWLITPLS